MSGSSLGPTWRSINDRTTLSAETRSFPTNIPNNRAEAYCLKKKTLLPAISGSSTGRLDSDSMIIAMSCDRWTLMLVCTALPMATVCATAGFSTTYTSASGISWFSWVTFRISSLTCNFRSTIWKLFQPARTVG
uniref:(northern house mosquito) hypothetical protein n=1 Tax=Culex pipiens TaxID=7175 RepID=A0A8D8NYH4_CULPI